MVKISGTYKGELRCESCHDESGTILVTDAPKDNEGEGASFSPTDLLVTSLATCIVTIMGIVAKQRKVALEGMRYEAEKIMSEDLPRRIAEMRIEIWMPQGIEEGSRKVIESAAQKCPVKKSIHPDIKVSTVFHWPEN